MIPDVGSVTILWSQPVGGLQILSPDGKWRWVRHIDNALVRPLYHPS
jgi:isopenicillin N synthase-like dioxygenase